MLRKYFVSKIDFTYFLFFKTGCKNESISAYAYFFVGFAPLPLGVLFCLSRAKLSLMFFHFFLISSTKKYIIYISFKIINYFRYLSVGTNFVALQYEFLLGRSTIGNIVRETCQVLWNTLQPEEMPEPNPDQWTEIANKFYLKTNFPNCVGAVDGKHIRCIKPINSGSMFYNYKKYFSIVLMAVVDAEYSFISIDVGAYNKEGDSTIFKNCPFGKKLYSEQLNLPAPVVLPNTDSFPQPFVVIGDEAFGLHKNLLRPYPGRGLTQKRKIFNYRLSRARRFVECAFGILANKWRVLHSAILVEPDFADDVILHNYVRRRDGYNFEDTLSNFLEDIQNENNSGARQQGLDIREYFAEYFMEAGAVPFQYRFV